MALVAETMTCSAMPTISVGIAGVPTGGLWLSVYADLGEGLAHVGTVDVTAGNEPKIIAVVSVPGARGWRVSLERSAPDAPLLDSGRVYIASCSHHHCTTPGITKINTGR